MAVSRTYAPVAAQDFTLRAVDLYRTYSYSSSIFANTGSGYILQEGFYRRDPTPIGSSLASNDPRNSVDGSYKHVIWKSIDHRYYRFPYDAYATFEHYNKSFTSKNLYETASVLTAPYLDFGLGVKPGTVYVENTTLGLSAQDDGFGNLRIPYDTGSFADHNSLAGYWGFNTLFRTQRYFTGKIEERELYYQSSNHSIDVPSQIYNIQLSPGVPINATNTGLGCTFNSDGYILTPSRPELNFVDHTDYTLSVWVKLPTSQSRLDTNVNDIISKHGVIQKITYGWHGDTLVEGTTRDKKGYSSSFHDENTNVFPYCLQVVNQTSADSGKIQFTANNGSKQIKLLSSGSLNDNTYHHIAVTKSGSLYTLYVDGVANQSGSAPLKYCSNEHSIMFGARNRQGLQGLSGSIDEVRLYEYACPPNEIATLSDNTNGGLYQTDIIGNVFYKRGVFVLSTLLPAYKDLFKNGWNLKYKGTHTVYQYEVLCRIRKGDFNLSMNPSARVHPKSDILIDDFTGSLLKPYVTTVGLYSDAHELLAIGKLGQPLQMRDDVDINISVQWDA